MSDASAVPSPSVTPGPPRAEPALAPPPIWLRWLVWLGLAAVVAVLLRAHAVILAPFALSIALAYVLEPGVSRLERWRLPRAAGAALCLAGVLLLGTLLVTLLVPIVLDLVPKLKGQLPDMAANIWHAVAPKLAQFGVKVPQELNDLRPLVENMLRTHGDEWARAALGSLRVGGSWALTLMGLAVLVPVLAFYWLLDWSRLAAGARSLLPRRWRRRVVTLADEVDEVLGQYLRGQLLVMLALALYYSLGLLAFGFDLAWPIGVFTGLAVFIPYLGFGLGLLLALLSGVLQFTADPLWPLMAVGVVYGLGQVLESFFLTPRLVGERIGLHPGGVILALMLFGSWMGFVGVLLALPVSALIMVFIRHGVRLYKGSAFYGGPA